MLKSSDNDLSILRLLLSVNETSAPYNQFTLAWPSRRQITLCSYFKAGVAPPAEVVLLEGNGSLPRFLYNIRTALTEKQYDIVHVHAPLLGPIFLVLEIFTPKAFISATVLTVHNSYGSYKLRDKLMFIPAFAFFERVVCCGRQCYESFPAFFKWLAGKRLCVVQNGMDINRVDDVIKNTEDPIRNDRFTISSVGRLIDIKNPISILKAFKRVDDPASRLVFIGKGNLHALLSTQIQESGLEDRVRLTGLMPREAVYKQLLRSDLFISASRGEGLPIAALEAMACGCPVVLSDIPPHREIAAGTDVISLIEPDDIAGYTREIIRFKCMPLAERKEIAKKCRRLVEERFSLTSMHRGYEGIFQELIRNRSMRLRKQW